MSENRPEHPLDETPPKDKPVDPTTKPDDVETQDGETDPGETQGPGKNPPPPPNP